MKEIHKIPTYQGILLIKKKDKNFLYLTLI
jgi:hypothetical protein